MNSYVSASSQSETRNNVTQKINNSQSSSSNEQHQNSPNSNSSSVSDNFNLILAQAKQRQEMENELISLRKAIVEERQAHAHEKEEIFKKLDDLITEKSNTLNFLNSLIDLLNRSKLNKTLKIFNSSIISDTNSDLDMVLTTITEIIKENKKLNKFRKYVLNEMSTSNERSALNRIIKIKKQSELINGFSDLKEIIICQSKLIKNVLKEIRNKTIGTHPKLCDSLEETNSQLNDQVDRLISKAEENSKSEIFSKIEIATSPIAKRTRCKYKNKQLNDNDEYDYEYENRNRNYTKTCPFT